MPRVASTANATQRARRLRIADLVTQSGSVSIDRLVEVIGTSTMTMYRDLAALEEAGVLRRGRGAVSAVATQLNEASAVLRVTQNVEEKKAIARCVARLIRPGTSMMCDDSTSALWLARALAPIAPLTFVTNSQMIAQEVQHRANTKLFMLGGEYQAWGDCFLGQTTLDNIERTHAEYCVVSASGISEGKVFHPYEGAAQVKRAMMAASSTSILVIDHTKFERHALHAFGRMTDFDIVVVDDATPLGYRTQLEEQGIVVKVAERAV